MMPFQRTLKRGVFLCLAAFGLTCADWALAKTLPCAEVQAALGAIDVAIQLYRVEHGELPPERGWLEALRREKLAAHTASAKDAWGHDYAYRPRADGQYELLSVGPDGREDSADDQVKAEGWAWKSCQEAVRSGCSVVSR